MSRRYFTLDQVNLLIPQLADIMGRAVQLHALLNRAVRTLADAGVRVGKDVLAGSKAIHTPEGSEKALAQARALYGAVLQEVAQIEALGGEVKGVDQGLVDFWSYLDGETEVLLCWKLGERRVTHYHTEESGFAGRQPVEGHIFGSRQEHTLRQ